MSRPVVLIGASGLAREVIETVRVAGGHELAGVLDDDPRQHGLRLLGVPVLGGLDVLAERPDAQVVLCTGRGHSRRQLAHRLDLPDNRYATVVHPSVHLPASCTLGAGTVVLAGCALTADVTVGRHCVLMPHVTCTHDDRIDDFATVCAGVALGGGVRVGTGAYLGMRASVRENLRIGSDSVVGMGSVVVRDIPAAQTWAGTPARPRPALTTRDSRATA